MKRYIKAFFLGAVLALAACSAQERLDDAQSQEPVLAKANSVTFSIRDGAAGRMLTRAAANKDTVSIPALVRERTVYDLYAVVFSENNVFYQTFYCNLVDSVNAAYSFDMLLPGNYTMYLVANPDNALRDNLIAGVETPDSLSRIVCRQTPGDDNHATHFLMTASPVSLTMRAREATTISDPIKLVRAAARFDFYNRVEKLRINKITLKNRYTQCTLNSQVTQSASLAKEDKVYRVVADSTGRDFIGYIYGYENLSPNTVLTLEGTYNGQPVKSHDFVLENMTINRNHLYSLILNTRGDSVNTTNPAEILNALKFEMMVNDWSEGADFVLDSLIVINGDQPWFVVKSNSSIYTSAQSQNNYNPQTIYVRSNAATDVELDVMQYAVGSQLLYGYGKMTPGDTITLDRMEDIGGILHSYYKIHLGATDGRRRRLQFVLQNPMQPTANRIFYIEQYAGGTSDRPKLPLEFVCEYNMVNDTTFATSHANDSCNYWAWSNASSKFNKTVHIKGTDYHMPTSEDWQGIFIPTTGDYIRFGQSTQYTNSYGTYNIRVKNNDNSWTTQTVTSYYRNNTNQQESKEYNICYAVANTDASPTDYYRCAYRYERYYTPHNPSGYIVKVTCRYLGPNYVYNGTTYANGSTNNTNLLTNVVAHEDWWKQNTEEDIIRYFPLCGYFTDGADHRMNESATNRGTYGLYWDANNSYSMRFYTYAHSTYNNSTWNSYSKVVRMFTNH